MSKPTTDAPFSYRVKVGHVSHNPIEVHVEADARELKALASFWQTLSVDALSADVKLRRWKKDGVKVFGELRGRVTQACVVTLEPVESEIFEEIDQIFVPEGSALARIPANDEGELIVDPDGPDLPETFVGDTIDVGMLVAELAAMGLDPYPRKSGVEFSGHVESTAADDKRPSPFAALKSMKLDK
ncbi:uncharacterized metal-binding protein YceD (DUF177 family) [Rhizobium sp. SG_E_25_P2]|uniref:YceD family protein n=1 Tax=Rhizobium sp. SG_E_25_P2 TaxID=2879942 RepID=UPI0024759023|nr:DUF177 domain-containing protein [Rhizobium sp. SG_E_25_P2]MDH6266706.1 uncharacterized metal-binding protein YceD (DUF177 family) [Rhizobium sp. SG_E_25_P2]